jgi:hypothetical protein
MLDYSIPSFAVTIANIDITDCVDAIALNQPTPQRGRLLTWAGSLELSLNQRSRIAHGEDFFNQLINPNLWRPALSDVRISIYGHPLPVMRIRKFAYRKVSRTGTAELYQILDAVAGDRPSQEVDLEIGINGNKLDAVVEALIDAAFVGTQESPAVSAGGLKGHLDRRLTTRDPIAEAQKICDTGYSWLSVDSAETVIRVPGDPMARPIVFARALSQVEEPEPDLSSIDFATEKVIVTGSRMVIVPPEKKQAIADEQTHDDEGRQLKLVVPTYKRKSALYPEIYLDENGIPTDTSLVLAELKTIHYRYWGISSQFESLPPIPGADGDPDREMPPLHLLGYEVGDLVETVTEFQRTQGELFPDIHPGGTGLILAETLVERDYCKLKYLTRGELFPEWWPGDTGIVLAEAEAIRSGRVNPDGTIPTAQKDGQAMRLERPIVRSFVKINAELPMESQVMRAEYKAAQNNYTPFVSVPLVEEVGFLPTQEHADNIAKQIALQEFRRRDALLITMPMPVEWLAAGCPSLARCRIDAAELQIENPVVVMREGALSFSFTGGYVGAIAPIPEPAKPGPWIPIDSIQIFPPSGIVAVVGSAISPIQLFATGGIPAYTWSGTLPAGLAISTSGLVTGTPTATASGGYSITATDSAFATTTAIIQIQAIAATPADPLISELGEAIALAAISVQVAVLQQVPLADLLGILEGGFKAVVTVTVEDELQPQSAIAGLAIAAITNISSEFIDGGGY